MVRAYHVGRYADPNSESLMHERHEVYRVEASSRWNLYPGPGPLFESDSATLSQGARDAAFQPFPVNDAILAEVNSQKLATAQIMAQARTLSAALGQFQTALQQTKTNVQETTALRAILKNMEQRLAALETAQRQSPSIIQETNDAKIPFPAFVPVP
jgi:hypothetical protein